MRLAYLLLAACTVVWAHDEPALINLDGKFYWNGRVIPIDDGDHRDADRRVPPSPLIEFSKSAWFEFDPHPDFQVVAGSKEVLLLKANGEVWINGERMKSNREFYFKFKRLLNMQCP